MSLEEENVTMETESKTGDSVAAGDATQSARTSPMTKERFMATYRFQGNEKFWEKWKAELENPNHNYHRLALESAQTESSSSTSADIPVIN